MLTINTMNRIEEKQTELGYILSECGYAVNCDSRQWAYDSGEIPRDCDYLRILENSDRLRKAFYVLQNTPNTPTDMFHFQHVNDVEKTLVDIETLIYNMKSGWSYPCESNDRSGYCGGGTQI